MALNAKNIAIITNDNLVEEPKVSVPLPFFNKTELEIILSLIKDSHFKGENVQNIYNLVLKIQEYYVKLP
jgi:hypothetical protein